MTIEESIGQFRDYMTSERRMAKGTVENYMRDLADLAGYLHNTGVDNIEDLEARGIREWQMLHLGRGEAAGTVKRRLSSVGSWVRWMRRHGLCHKDIMIKISAPRQPKRMPVFFKENEVEHLYDEGLFDDGFKGRRDALILRVLYETGVRRSELVGMKESSVDFGTRAIKVLGKRSKERIIPIENELAHNISDYIALKRQEVGESEWLFVNKKGEQLSAAMVYNIVKRYMSLLSNADRISPHVFRHSFATHILSEGGDMMAIKELLGHESLSTTEVYTHITREHLKDVYRHAHPRGKKQ